MTFTPQVTIVVRARNEAFWMPRLLAQIRAQTFRDFEIVLVDNKSTDTTREIFAKNSVNGRIVEIENFRPGKAINIGIAAGTGPLVVILSAHCIPVDENWLASFVKAMTDPGVAAAYGRQLPLPTSHPLDKRDLLNTFGIERRVQRKDTFFHNANSIIRREIWEKFRFDEETLHIEDRLWASQIIQNGMGIAYEPDAAVYHHHGINHHGDASRAHVISDILTKHTLENGDALPRFLSPDSSATLYCFLGHDEETDPKFRTLLAEMKLRCPAGRYFVHSRAGELITGQNADVEVLSRAETDNSLTFVDILRRMLHSAYESGFYPDCLVYINLRQETLRARRVGESVGYFYNGMYDSVFYAHEEFCNVWQKSDSGSYEQLRPDYSNKKDPIYLALYGQGLATRPKFIENGNLVGNNVAILNMDEVDANEAQARSERLRLVGKS